uniref:Uncharacterized protein n=1 Tax=Arundo donax TaxID=35708 RepID=A0A0A9E0U8_ARUDO
MWLHIICGHDSLLNDLSKLSAISQHYIPNRV